MNNLDERGGGEHKTEASNNSISCLTSKLACMIIQLAVTEGSADELRLDILVNNYQILHLSISLN